MTSHIGPIPTTRRTTTRTSPASTTRRVVRVRRPHICRMSVPWKARASAGTRSAASAADELPLLPPKRRHPDLISAREQPLMVDGSRNRGRRPERGHPARRRYRTQIHNINNAARNLVEIIANEARNDASGDYRIRIYTIGMGNLVRLQLGTRPETSESMLMRVANDAASPDSNADSARRKYYSPRPKRTSPRRSRRCRTRSSV